MHTAMILSAGSGQRMAEMGKVTPKALLNVGGKPLIAYHLERLADAGIRKVIINLAHLGEQIRHVVGSGETYGIQVEYSQEQPGGLETGGGIFQALPLLGSHPFIVINGDIWTDFKLQDLPNPLTGLAHLVLVDNPPHNPEGDFSLIDNGLVSNDKRLTFSGIGIYSPEMFAACSPGKFRLAPLLRTAITHKRVTGQYYPGRWFDIGTPERLALVQSLINI